MFGRSQTEKGPQENCSGNQHRGEDEGEEEMGEIEKNQTVERDDNRENGIWIGRERGQEKIGSGKKFHRSKQEKL